jgi:hypothetical protein
VTRFKACCSAPAKILATRSATARSTISGRIRRPGKSSPVNEPRGAAIGKADLIGTAVRNDFVLD